LNSVTQIWHHFIIYWSFR